MPNSMEVFFKMPFKLNSTFSLYYLKKITLIGRIVCHHKRIVLMPTDIVLIQCIYLMHVITIGR